jgi:hypothetical protein
LIERWISGDTGNSENDKLYPMVQNPGFQFEVNANLWV